jgi:hypothetical protein
VGGVADDDHAVPVPPPHRRQVVGGPGRQLTRRGVDDRARRGAVGGEQRPQPRPPVLGGQRGELSGGRLRALRWVGEPPDAPVRCHGVAEERALAEHHLVLARNGAGLLRWREPAGVEHRHVAGRRRGRVDDLPDAGADAVGTDEEVGGGRAAVGELGPHPARLRPRAHEPAAVLDPDPATQGLVAQRAVEVAAPQRATDRAVRQRCAGAHLAEHFAGPAAESHARRGEAESGDDVSDAERAERADAVDLQRHERPELVGRALARFVHGGLEAGPLQRDRHHRPRDPRTDHRRCPHDLPSSRTAEYLACPNILA